MAPRAVDLDRPTIIRNSAPRGSVGTAAAFLQELDEDIINIPAFLRHQAD